MLIEVGFKDGQDVKQGDLTCDQNICAANLVTIVW
jgi:hypothetical protein